MNIDSIKNGIVIDHITAGKAMDLYFLLGLDKLDNNHQVAIMQTVTRWAKRIFLRQTEISK